MTAQGHVDMEAVVRQFGSELSAKLIAAVDLANPVRGKRFEGDEAHIFLYIQRSKNANVVCYRATYDESNELKPDAPIDAYWLDIDPEYVKANRANGKNDDRCELNLIDRTMAYGHTPSTPKQVPGTGQVYFEVSFVALSTRHFALLNVHDAKRGGLPVPALVAVVEGHPSVVSRIYVKAAEPKHFFSLPSVEYVEVFGTRIADGQPSYEKLKP